MPFLALKGSRRTVSRSFFGSRKDECCPPCNSPVTAITETPAPGSAHTSNDSSIVFDFNPGTVDSFTLVVGGVAVAGSFVWNKATKTVTFTHSGSLIFGTAVSTVVVNKGGRCEQTFTWTWTAAT